jgi:chromosome segregation ATPase
MSYPVIITIAMTGAASLAFLFAWTLQHLKNKKLREEINRLTIELKETQGLYERCDSQLVLEKESKNSLQSWLQDIENQALNAESALKKLQLEYQNLLAEYRHLEQHPVEKIKEIEVIREVPVLVFRGPGKTEDRRKKAQQLVKAFRKGYEDKKKAAPTP